MAAPIIDRDAMPVDRRRRRGADRSVLGLLLIGLGLIWFLDETGLLALSAETILSIFLMLIGLGLILTARHGRKHWPIILGVVITLALVANSGTLSFPNMSNVGHQTFRPLAGTEVRDTYNSGFGTLTVDLTSLPIAALDNRKITVRQGSGQVIIRVPAEIALHVSAQIGFGHLSVCGANVASGPGINETRDAGPAKPSAHLNLDIHDGFGNAEVDGCGAGGLVPEAPSVPPVTTVPA